MSARRAVLFDIGDTLVHRPTIGPGRRIAEALGLTREQGRTIGAWLFREPFATPAALATRIREAFGHASGVATAPDSTIEEALARIWTAQESEPEELPGATACVAAVRERGARVAVVSNIWAPYEAGFRRACPAIVPLIESWHLSYRAGVAKPDRALFLAALRALDVAPAAAIMVGDSLEKDIEPALALGMRAVWIPVPGAPNTAAGADGGAHAASVIPDLAAARIRLLELLDAPV